MRSLRVIALVAPIAFTTGCSSSSGPETNGESPENVAQTESALQSTAALTGVLTQGTRAAYHFLGDAPGSVRDLRTSGCAKTTTRLVPRGVFVSVDFGTGCEVPELGSVSGSLAMTLVAERGAVAFDVAFESFSLGGLTLTGGVSIAANGRQAALKMNLTSVVDQRSSHVELDGTSVRDGAGGATLGGTGLFQSGDAKAIAFSADALHVVLGSCYADAGTLSIDPVTVTFLSTTPSDGKVSLNVFGMTSTSTLPAYGRCPR
jgi:hypothetical protein